MSPLDTKIQGHPRRLAGVIFRALQLGLVILVLRSFELESRALLTILELALGGYLIQACLASRWHLPFFAGISLAGIVLVLGLPSAAWVVGLGLLLLALCHLPIAFPGRVAAVAVAGLLLAAMRGSWLPNQLPPGIWPVLGSMFMFRLLIYLYDIRHDKEPFRLSRAISYFFLLPNVCFPLFPVVDYKTFRSTYQKGDQPRVHQQGLDWILRGLLHLLLYRVVYYHLTIGIGDVHSLGTLTRFLLGNIFLYLRISGHFHLIVGLLKLFGFNLPETNHLYFLASSFNDYWRRINIYWKDFMMKVFYYPVFFQMRRWGQTRALVLSTGLVFILSWMLHSYQWFWILGDFPIRAQDGLFWGIVGALVLVNTLHEAVVGRRRSLKRRQWSLRQSLVHVVRVALVFSTICILWSLWTTESLEEWASMWQAAATDFALQPMEILLLLTPLFLGLAAVLEKGALTERVRIPDHARRAATPVTLALLVVAGAPHLYDQILPKTALQVADLKVQRLNQVDQERLEGGYYQQLLTVDRLDSALLNAVVVQPVARPAFQQEDLFHWGEDFVRVEIRPNRQGLYQGQSFSSNRWGMRDRDYRLEKPQNTKRLLLLGSSHVMGHGVANDEMFDPLLEEHLNQGAVGNGSPAWEVLNLAVADHAAVEQLLFLRDRGLRFSPDVAFYFGHTRELAWTTKQLWQTWLNRREIPLLPLRDMVLTALDPDKPKAIQKQQIYNTSGEALAWIYREMAETCRANDIKPIYIFLPRVDEFGATRHRSFLLETAEEAGFYVINIANLYQGRDRDALKVSPTDYHPNPRGHELIARRLYDEIRQHGEMMGWPQASQAEEGSP